MYFTSQAYFNSVLNFLSTHHIPIEQSLWAISFEQFTQYKTQQRVELVHYSALLDYGKVILGDPLFGFRVGCDIQNADYGVLGYLVESSENLASAIQSLLVFDKLVANIGTIDYQTNDQHTAISWTPVVPCSEQVVLRNMASWLTTARQLLGNELAPTTLSLSHHFQDEQRQQLEQFYRCAVQTDAPINEITFSSEILAVAFRGDNPTVNRTMAALSQQELAQQQLASLVQPTVSHQLVHLLSIKPDLQDCTLIQFSQVFSMSPRTLQRQLNSDGMQFGTLLDNERQQRAKQLINNIKLGQLSQHLGFNEQSSFNRAFKRWFGCTPSAYQRTKT